MAVETCIVAAFVTKSRYLKMYAGYNIWKCMLGIPPDIPVMHDCPSVCHSVDKFVGWSVDKT